MNIFLDEMQDYLEDLCTKHIDIQHNTDGKRCFARFQSEEHIEEIEQSGGLNIVVIANYYGQRIGEIDEKKIRQVIKIRFASTATGANDRTTAINNAVKKAESIMFDFMTKLQNDFEEDDCGLLRFVDFEKMSWDAFEGDWLASFYGFDLEVPFKSYMPAYDAAKWTNVP
ncbi:MAG: hypothetical protein ACJ748_11335 [Flavisolibacter sp.]|jgi:hypothetical protein